ncbi:MAG: hypothetical protein IPK60_01960 [Sandaracinaceae bacterium]|nr:hypothetical protein [Sandaracinaceae bacterium]
MTVLVCFACAFWAASARADDVAQQTLIARAEAFERESDPRQAIVAWSEALAASPSSRLARRCETRIAYLEARRENDFVPLARLMRMRQGGRASQTRPSIERFEATLDALPAGIVRKESRMLVAEAWMSSIRDPRRAIRAYRALLLLDALEGNERRAILSGLASAYSALGDSDAAVRALNQAGLGDTPVGATIRLEGERRVGRVAAYGALVVFILLAAAAIWRARIDLGAVRKTLAGPRIAAAVFVTVIPLVLARAYDASATDTFTLLGACVMCILFVASLAGEAFDARKPAKAFAVATACSAAFAVLATGYLLLDRAGGLIAIGL